MAEVGIYSSSRHFSLLCWWNSSNSMALNFANSLASRATSVKDATGGSILSGKLWLCLGSLWGPSLLGYVAKVRELLEGLIVLG